ncbi:MAG TPA: carboxypeptidase-like regulatory domain-containing protein [Polyangiaceae bacterium]|nr:carboxypeptidase-like regulatory domain-containing protein [Polyangiaceae bacterium]
MLPERRFADAALLGLALTWAASASAGPEARLRVHGASHIEAAATVSPRGTELIGSVRDDAGRTVSAARIRVRLLTEAGPRPLPRPAPCEPQQPPPEGGPSEAGDEALAETDLRGHFCLRWSVELPHGRLALEFDDERKLFDPSSLVVELERSPPLTIAFAPAPRSISADDAEVTVVVQSKARSADTSERVPVALSWARVGGSTTRLASGELRAGEALRLSFSPTLLGGPGSGELIASAELGSRSVQARAPVPVTARVELELPAAPAVNAEGETSLRVRVLSGFGAVPSGTVEAIVAGRTAGIAPVVRGSADLPVSLGPRSGERTVTIRYLSATPWWTPGGEQQLVLTVPPASPWRWLPWAFGLFGIAAWVLAAWRRPTRHELPNSNVTPPQAVEPALAWAPEATQAKGWTGRVFDAHDGVAVAGANIQVLWPHGATLTATSGPSGDFTLDFQGAVPDAGIIRVEARWHAALERPLPPPGRLSVSLVTRRRALLGRLVEWSGRRGLPPGLGPKEPTPADLRHASERAGQLEVANWAGEVEAAVFGPAPVDSDREAEVRSLEPPS